MLVGTGREIINPEIGHHLCGYGDCYPNGGVHDDISVTALFLDDGTRKALLLVYDLIGLVKATQDRICAAVSAATGVPEPCIFLACTHVHSAPDVVEGSLDCRADYMQRLVEWSGKSGATASRAVEECQLRYNYTYAQENMNRRYNFPDRRFLYI